jgi:uncharacterized glyoxalase superfamily protein PhnB
LSPGWDGALDASSPPLDDASAPRGPPPLWAHPPGEAAPELALHAGVIAAHVAPSIRPRSHVNVDGAPLRRSMFMMVRVSARGAPRPGRSEPTTRHAETSACDVANHAEIVRKAADARHGRVARHGTVDVDRRPSSLDVRRIIWRVREDPASLRPMKPPPKDWPRIASALFYEDPATAIDWLCNAFGFKCRMKVDGAEGQIVHSELVLDGGVIMVAGTKSAHRPEVTYTRSPRQLGGANTQTMMVYVDDADAHCAHARAAGATIVHEPQTTDYGEGYWADRSYQAMDPEGHNWWFAQRISG